LLYVALFSVVRLSWESIACIFWASTVIAVFLHALALGYVRNKHPAVSVNLDKVPNLATTMVVD
jgi:hypothetical protein